MNCTECDIMLEEIIKLQLQLMKAITHINFYSYATRIGLRDTPELKPRWEKSHINLGLKIP